MTNEYTVPSVKDTANGDRLVDATDYLGGLSHTRMAELRAEQTRRSRRDQYRFVCAHCDWPVYHRLSLSRQPHFAHRGDDSRPLCPWGRGGEKPEAVDAIKFRGAAEGARHQWLKMALVRVLATELNPEDIEVERQQRAPNGEFKRPDVFAEGWRGCDTAFDIQLATTHVDTIVRREDFYRRHGCRYVWIVDGKYCDLNRQGFRDIYLRNGGQILGVDEEALKASEGAAEVRFRHYQYRPTLTSDGGITPVLRESLVEPWEIDWGDANRHPRSRLTTYDNYLVGLIDRTPALRQERDALYSALLDESASVGYPRRCALHWDRIAEQVGGMRWQQLPGERDFDDVFALGTLVTLRTGQAHLDSRIPLINEVSWVNNHLLGSQHRVGWASVFTALCRSLGKQYLWTDRSSVQRKLREAQHVADVEYVGRNSGPVLDVVIPEGAFSRLRLREESSSAVSN